MTNETKQDINMPPQAEFYTIEELAPCVHCEADGALLGTTENLWKLICYNCMRQTADHLTETGAIAAWNNDWNHRVAGPPKWTKEPPKEEGWYLARFYGDLPLEPVRIVPSRLGGFFVSTWDGDWHTFSSS